METKQSLRSQFGFLRREFNGRERESAQQALLANVRRLSHDLDQPDLQVGLYRAKSDEASCELNPLTDYFFPRLNGDNLEFLQPGSISAFSVNPWDIAEPIPKSSTPMRTDRPMLIFCPAVALDLRGTRLGMGRAYYDRFFNQNPHAVRVGVIYHFQLVAHLPREAWDQPVDWLVTDKMIVRTSTRSS